jgi:predicted aspartyl protease
MPVILVPLTTSGAILGVEVRASVAYAPNGPTRVCNALIDTGATMTAIDPAILAAIDAQVIGGASIAQPGGMAVRVNTHDVRIRFGGQGRHYDIEAAAVAPVTPGVGMLIGVDLLLRIRMVWDGRGRLFTLIVR